MGRHKPRHEQYKSPVSEKRNQQANEAPADKPKKHFWSDWEPIAWFNFVIAVFAVVSALVSIGSLFVAKSTLTISQRAFVIAEDVAVNVGPPPEASTPPAKEPIVTINVNFKNTGQTWARNVTTSLNCYFVSGETRLPANFTWPVQGRTRPTLLPPQHLTVGAEPISQSQLDTVTSRKQTLLVYGDVTYQDIFGKWYKTEYCFQFYNAVGKSHGTVAFQFFYCPTHNCADEDCPS